MVVQATQTKGFLGMSHRIKSFLATAFVLAILAIPAPTNAAASPERFVEDVTKQVLAAARSRSSKRFRRLLRRHADVRAMANFALGRYRNRLPKSRRAEYYRLTEKKIVQFFGDYAGSLRGDGIQIRRVKKLSATQYLVQTKLTGPGGGTPVSWKISTRKGYKVHDVRVAGVWLGQLMRTTFVGEIRKNNGQFKKLFAYLKE